MTAWYNYDINVPYGDPNFDAGLGGSHDMDVRTPIDTPITALVGGVVSSVSSPTWGKQITVKMDNPVNGVPYIAYLHLDAIAPGIGVGTKLQPGTLIGYSGGANSYSQLNSAIAASPYQLPSGLEHFLDTAFMSSQPQTGIALSYGPEYGSGAGWASIQSALDPTPLLNSIRKNGLPNGDLPLSSPVTGVNGSTGSSDPITGAVKSFTDFLTSAGVVVFGGVIVIIALFLMFKQQ